MSACRLLGAAGRRSNAVACLPDGAGVGRLFRPPTPYMAACAAVASSVRRRSARSQLRSVHSAADYLRALPRVTLGNVKGTSSVTVYSVYTSGLELSGSSPRRRFSLRLLL